MEAIARGSSALPGLTSLEGVDVLLPGDPLALLMASFISSPRSPSQPKFPQLSSSPQKLQRSRPFSRAQTRMGQSGGPPPLSHPGQRAYLLIHSSPSTTWCQSIPHPSSETRGAQSGILQPSRNPLALSAVSATAPLPRGQKPQTIPQGPTSGLSESVVIGRMVAFQTIYR